MIALTLTLLLAAPLLPMPHGEPALPGVRVAQLDEDAIGQLLASNDVPEPPDPEDEDSLEQALFQPDFIIEHQKEIALDDKQRNAIIDEIAKAQGDVVRNRWKLHAATVDLKTLLQSDKVDETKAMAKADEVMGLERDVKRANLTMLIRIKNQLTPDQRKKLKDERDGDDDDDIDADMIRIREQIRHAKRDAKHAREMGDEMRVEMHHRAPKPPMPPTPPLPPPPAPRASPAAH